MSSPPDKIGDCKEQLGAGSTEVEEDEEKITENLLRTMEKSGQLLRESTAILKRCHCNAEALGDTLEGFTRFKEVFQYCKNASVVLQDVLMPVAYHLVNGVENFCRAYTDVANREIFAARFHDNFCLMMECKKKAEVTDQLFNDLKKDMSWVQSQADAAHNFISSREKELRKIYEEQAKSGTYVNVLGVVSFLLGVTFAPTAVIAAAGMMGATGAASIGAYFQLNAASIITDADKLKRESKLIKKDDSDSSDNPLNGFPCDLAGALEGFREVTHNLCTFFSKMEGNFLAIADEMRKVAPSVEDMTGGIDKRQPSFKKRPHDLFKQFMKLFQKKDYDLSQEEKSAKKTIMEEVVDHFDSGRCTATKISRSCRGFKDAFAEARQNLGILRDIPDFFPSDHVPDQWRNARFEEVAEAACYPPEDWDITITKNDMIVKYLGSYDEVCDLEKQLKKLGGMCPLLSFNDETDAMILEPCMGINPQFMLEKDHKKKAKRGENVGRILGWESHSEDQEEGQEST